MGSYCHARCSFGSYRTIEKISMPARKAAMYAETHPDNNGSIVYISKLVNWPFIDNAKKLRHQRLCCYIETVSYIRNMMLFNIRLFYLR